MTELAERAFDRAPAREANQAISRVRQQLQARWGPAKSIEIVIRPDEDAGALRKRLMPTLPTVVEGFGADLAAGEGPVFMSVFAGEELLFLTPAAFMEGLHAAAGPVALLP